MKKFWNVLKPFIYSYTFQYLFIIVGMIIYFIVTGNVSVLDSIDMTYQYMIGGLVITSIPISIYLFRKYRIKESKIKFKKLLIMVPLGMSISLFYNMLTIKFQVITAIDINIILLFIYIVIIAPIFEELVFRYVSLRNAKEYYSEEKAMVLISIVFALMHSGLINIVYAFLIGMILSYVYGKYKNILYPIILHISANAMSMFISEFNMIALIVSTIVLLLIMLYLRDE